METRKERKPFTVIEAISVDKARVAGHVKWFDPRKVIDSKQDIILQGYGFITTEGENPKDYFVHRTQLYTEDHFPRHPVLFNKEAVEFVIGESEQGPVAEEVSLPEGKIVPG